MKEVYSPYVALIEAGMSTSEAVKMTNQITEEIKELIKVGCIKDAEGFSKYARERVFDMTYDQPFIGA